MPRIIRQSWVVGVLDPIEYPDKVFDPSDPRVVGELTARTLLAQPMAPLAGISAFYGSGVYAIYYRGNLPVYAAIRAKDHPLYIGKADPAKPEAETVREQGVRLVGRLNDHVRSLSAAENLSIDDFHCRYLVVKSAWQGTAEEYLIRRFQPVWNNEMGVCYGFGKHGDSPKMRSNTRSPWDTLHPGRKWAAHPDKQAQSPDSRRDWARRQGAYSQDRRRIAPWSFRTVAVRDDRCRQPESGKLSGCDA